MGLAVIVIANDFSAINVALPVMEKDFHTNINTLQWVINAYALTFGVLIVTAGRRAEPVRAPRGVLRRIGDLRHDVGARRGRPRPRPG